METQTKTPPAGPGFAGFVQKTLARALQLRLVRAFLLYSEHRGSMLADSITYRTLFSVFAGVLLLFSVAALWLSGNPDAMRALSDSLDAVVPGLSSFVSPEKIPTFGFTIVGIVSLAGLVSAAVSAIKSLRTALRVLADELTDDASFVRVLLRNLLVGVGFGGLLVAAAAASFLGSSGIGMVSGWLGIAESSTAVVVATRVFGIAVVFLIDTAAIALMFRLLSGVAAPARALWGGALLGGAGLTILQELSGLFVRGATSNPLLASFASIIALLLWFNLSAQVILIASSYIITATAEAEDRVREKFGAATLAQHRRLRAESVVQAANLELRAAQRAEREEREKLAERARRQDHAQGSRGD